MPELPEVETIMRNLIPKINGFRIRSVTLLYPALLRNRNRSIISNLKGNKIVGLRRRGKMILIDCENEMSLLFHLKMTGQFLLCPRKEPMDKHTHFILSFENQNKELRFRDVRKFGFISCIRASDDCSEDELKNLGPEPLEIDFFHFHKLFQGRKARLKSLLLNQSFLAGIGNIYSDEILFQAKLHPLTPASYLDEKALRRLFYAMRDVLREAIEQKGSSVRSFLDANGQKGNFQNFHRVYGKESFPCSICGEKIERIRLGGRSSFFCPKCQIRES